MILKFAKILLGRGVALQQRVGLLFKQLSLNRIGGVATGKLGRVQKCGQRWKADCDEVIRQARSVRYRQHVNAQTTYIHVWDVCQVLESMAAHQLAAMNDPSGATGRIYACSSDSKRDEALSKLTTAAGRARKALDAHNAKDPYTAFYYLDLLFGGKFPAR